MTTSEEAAALERSSSPLHGGLRMRLEYLLPVASTIVIYIYIYIYMGLSRIITVVDRPNEHNRTTVHIEPCLSAVERN